MISKAEAEKVATDAINANFYIDGDSLVAVSKETIEKPYGWIFFFDSKRFLSGEDTDVVLIGNGPVLVRSLNGSAIFLGTHKAPATLISEWESKNT